MKRLALITVLLLLLAVSQATASNTYRFRSKHIEDGLSQSTIHDCFQDSRGFIWITTEDGLNRYDGYEFKVFRHDPTDRNSLSYSYISRTCEDDNGGLWIGTFGQGLNKYNYRTQQFVHFLHNSQDPSTISDNNVLTVVKGPDGYLWVGTGNGLNRLDPNTGIFERYRWPDGPNGGNNDIQVILPRSDGKLWLGTGGDGVALFDPQNSSCERFVVNNGTAASNVVLSLLECENDKLWLGTQHGLHVLDLTTKTMVMGPELKLKNFELEAAEVRAMVHDFRGNSWIATTAGLVRVDGASGSCELIETNSLLPASLSDNEISTLMIDRSHVMWLGTRMGLNYIDLEGKPFHGYAHDSENENSLADNYVRHFLEDEDNNLWVATFDGLDYWNRSQNSFTHFRVPTTELSDLSSNRIYSLAWATSGEIWLATQNGARLFSPKTGKYRRQGYHKSLPGKLSSEVVRVIHIDHRGDTWFGTEDGLNRLVKTTGEIEHFKHDSRNDTTLANDLIYAMAEDCHQNIWIGTINGLSLLSPDRRTFTNYRPDAEDPGSISSTEVLSLYTLPSGDVWVGTPVGLNRFHSDTDKFSLISGQDGLLNETIYTIAEDSAGSYWLSTNHGLALYDPKTGEIRTYDHSDGLLSDEFNLGAALLLSSGELVFGTIRGFNIFAPDEIRDNNLVPELTFTDFKLFNHSATIGAESPLQSHISVAQEITLSHKDYVFSFEFSALHFAISDKNQYATKLEGVDNDWVDIGTRHMVAYNNLPPGDYVFRVKAANCDGTWNEEGISVALKITPPFWQRSWFRALLILLAIALARVYFRIRTRGVERRNLELEKKVTERTEELERANEAKSEFLANMSHEIRTPLNCVIGVANLMMDLDPRPDQQNHLGMIHQSGNILLSLINNILDLSKVEADKLQLEPVKCDLLALCADVIKPLSTLTEAKDLDLVLRCSDSTPRWVTCDPLRLRQVLVNLINNAIKFSDAGEVVLDVSGHSLGHNSGRFDFQIIDSGQGIEADKQSMLFEKFTQADASTTRKYGGTGLGLAISKQLVELMGGMLNLQSTVGEGTTFYFSLTLDTDGVSIKDSPIDSLISNAAVESDSAADELSLNILLAEDNKFNQTVARHVLERMGCFVKIAENGKEAVEMSETTDFDVILMDCQMPEMDGYEATRQIRLREQGRSHIPIIAMTANAMAGDREKCLVAGMDDYLSKPMVKEDLAKALQAINNGAHLAVTPT